MSPANSRRRFDARTFADVNSEQDCATGRYSLINNIVNFLTASRDISQPAFPQLEARYNVNATGVTEFTVDPSRWVLS